MSAIVSKRFFVKTSAEDNNNKFWHVTLFSNNDVLCEWGRVGASGQKKTFSSAGQSMVDKKIKEKTKKGYTEIEGVNVPSAGPSKKVQGTDLKRIAKKQIKSGGCKVTEQLIEKLVKTNKHDIQTASGGRLTVDVDSGLITTDIGVAVNQVTLDKARDLLVNISRCITSKKLDTPEFVTNINQYLMCIPQKVPSKRGWEKQFIITQDHVQRQGSLIDSMESTLKAFEDAPIVADDTGKEEIVFNVELVLIDDSKEMDRINKLYQSTRKSMHQSHRLKVNRVFHVNIEHMAKAFDNDGAKRSPVWELWHGTRTANLLSILKCGLIIPPANAAHCTGRLYGNGIYFSDQSTKSLNYAYGYWDGGHRDNNCYMLLANVGMGKQYTPSGGFTSLPAGYDSCFAKAGRSGVMNNEMIVYKTSQCNLTRLVEFTL